MPPSFPYSLNFFRTLESDLARRSSFAPFSAFRPVNKISDILQLSSSQTKNVDSGEICEVSTTVDKDSEEVTSKFLKRISKCKNFIKSNFRR